MKKNKNIFAIFISLIALLIGSLSFSVAWFIGLSTYSSNFKASIVQDYFDAESPGYVSDTTSEYYGENVFYITKPAHLYNLSYLQNLGYFASGSYTFYLGKPETKTVFSDLSNVTTFKCYSENTSTESGDTRETPASDVLDMSNLPTKYKFEPIGNSGNITISGTSYSLAFDDVFKGNNLIISNLVVYIPDNVYSYSSLGDENPTDITSSSTIYGGMFGDVTGNTTSITNFNLDSPEIETGSSSTSKVIGLISGYVDNNKTDSNGLSVTGVGVKNGKFKGSNIVTSAYTLYGKVADKTKYEGNFIKGDTGYIDAETFSAGLSLNGTFTKDSGDAYKNFGIFSLLY